MVERSTVRLHDLRHSFASVGADASLGLHKPGGQHREVANENRSRHLSRSFFRYSRSHRERDTDNPHRDAFRAK
jgi:hypothetical protein